MKKFKFGFKPLLAAMLAMSVHYVAAEPTDAAQQNTRNMQRQEQPMKQGRGTGQGQGMNQGRGTGQGQGMNQGRGTGQGQGMNQGRGTGQGQGMNQGRGTGQGQGMNQGRGTGQGQGMNQGRGTGQGQGRSQQGNMPKFSDFDLDGDGQISKEELATARTDRISQRALEGRQMRKLVDVLSFEEIDVDGDGYISPQEFAAATARQQKKTGQRQGKAQGMN